MNKDLENKIKLLKAETDGIGSLLLDVQKDCIDKTKRLNKIAEIIESVDYRCMAADGPVSKTIDEMTDDELKKIYKLTRWKK